MERYSESELTKFEQIFYSYVNERKQDLLNSNSSYIHYTSAESAIKIIESKELWLRDSHCMNDFNEVYYGKTLIKKIMSDQHFIEQMKNHLNDVHPELFNFFKTHFDTSFDQVCLPAYFCSISEHPKDERDYGRLSMWRAYGCAGIVFDVPIDPIRDLPIQFLPVVYTTENGLKELLLSSLKLLSENSQFLNAYAFDELTDLLMFTLRTWAVSIKHPGFREEKEWRLVFFPKLFTENHLKFDTTVIKGIPQFIFKFPLERSEQFSQAYNLLDGVLIGPTQYGLAMHGAFTAKLALAGLEKPGSRVILSDIPLRT
jgi:hypothetical protein